MDRSFTCDSCAIAGLLLEAPVLDDIVSLDFGYLDLAPKSPCTAVKSTGSGLVGRGILNIEDALSAGWFAFESDVLICSDTAGGMGEATGEATDGLPATWFESFVGAFEFPEMFPGLSTGDILPKTGF